MKLLKLIGRALGPGLGQRRTAPKPQAKSSNRWMCSDPRANQMLKYGRYCALLGDAYEWRPDAVWAAAQMLDSEMVFVPGGSVSLQEIAIIEPDSNHAGSIRRREDSFFVDKHAVTNAQYKSFLDDDGYRTQELWPEEVWPFVEKMIDSTGVPGPASWRGGKHHPEKADHPVVGVSWFEASAYANWLGKQLPTSAQWQRAGTWWKPDARFPWGNDYRVSRLNTYRAGHGDTIAVNGCPASSTPYGVAQLVGNVWEWVSDCFAHVKVEGESVALPEPYGEIRGGAFDTYLPSQATCVFRSGQTLLSRSRNIGFRCAASADLLAVMTSE